MRRRRIKADHPDLLELAVTHPELARDAQAWGEARQTVLEMQHKWTSLQRVCAQLYALGLGPGAIGRVLHIERRNVYRELYHWHARNVGGRMPRRDGPSARDG